MRESHVGATRRSGFAVGADGRGVDGGQAHTGACLAGASQDNDVGLRVAPGREASGATDTREMHPLTTGTSLHDDIGRISYWEEFPMAARLPALSRRERQIMDVIHARRRATAAEVVASLGDSGADASIRKLIRILETKGW